MTVRLHSTHMSDHAYMRILPHNADLSANQVQPVFLLLPPALLAHFSLRFVKFLAGVYRAGAHVDNFVHSSECATSQFPFTNIDGELPGSEGLTGLCGSRVAVNPKHIERRKSRATVFKKLLYILVIFGFACVVTGQLDLKLKLPNVDLDFPFPLFLFQVQNPGELMPHFLCCLATVTDGRSIGRRIPQYEMLFFVIDSVIESNAEMQSTDAAHTPLPQQDIANLRVGTKRVSFGRILQLLVESQLEAMCEVILAVVIIRLLFSSECGLPA